MHRQINIDDADFFIVLGSKLKTVSFKKNLELHQD